MPCNTLHQLIPKIRESTSLEILDLIEEASSYIKKMYRKIGILSTNKTRHERLYDIHLEGVEIAYPKKLEQKHISKIIIRIIRNTSTNQDIKYLNKIIERMIGEGAEKVVLACTDLANIIGNNPHTVDSTDILIRMILNKMKN